MARTKAKDNNREVLTMVVLMARQKVKMENEGNAFWFEDFETYLYILISPNNKINKLQEQKKKQPK